MQYRVQLTEDQRTELQRRTRAVDIKPRTRDRLEMVRLADAGWPPLQIAAHFGIGAKRVRFWLGRFLTAGFDALPDQPHPGQKSRFTPELQECVRQELAQGTRTWTARQIAAWLEAEHHVQFSPHYLTELLRRAGLSCRRTERRLTHKQQPAQVAAERADLETLEKGAMPGAWISAT